MSGDFKLGVLIGLLILALMVIFLTNKPKTDDLAPGLADQQEAFVPEPQRPPEAAGGARQPSFAEAEHEPTADGVSLLSVQERSAAATKPKELVITQAASDDRTVAAQIGGRSRSAQPDTAVDGVRADSAEAIETQAGRPAKEIDESTFPLIHVAAKGETLSSISAKYYGTHKWFRHIHRANSSSMKSPDAVSVGQKIKVPAPPKTSRPAAPAAPALTAKADAKPGELRTTPSFVPRKHTVQKGESLCHISRTYYNGDESMWKRILDANKGQISDPRKLRVGASLVIPPI